MCDPDIFFHRVHPLISSWTALFEGQYDDSSELQDLTSQLEAVERLEVAALERGTGLPDLAPHREHLERRIASLQRRKRFCGPSGAMSTILPLCDGLLGISMSEALEAKLKALEEYMPAPHRTLLDEVRRYPLRSLILRLREVARRASGWLPASLSTTAATGVSQVSPSPSGGRGSNGGDKSPIASGSVAAAGVDATAVGVRKCASVSAADTWLESAVLVLGGDEALHDAVESLVNHYNAVVRRVLDIRWRHHSYIEDYIFKPSGGLATLGANSASACLYQHINDTEAALIPTVSLSTAYHPLAANASLDWNLPATALAEAAHAGHRLGAQYAARCELWAVTDERGFLPVRPPLDLDDLPGVWRAIVRILRRMPAACVPPATFRSLVATAAAHGDFPSLASIAALPNQDSVERARCVTEFVIAGWRAAKPPKRVPRQSCIHHPPPNLDLTKVSLLKVLPSSPWRPGRR